MALSVVACEGYKAFESRTELRLRPVTVIFGKNNSGKTTLARLPLFAMASLVAPEHYSLSWGELHFGNSFFDLTSSTAPHPSLWIRAATDKGESLECRLQYVTAFDRSDRVEVVWATLDGDSRTTVSLPWNEESRGVPAGSESWTRGDQLRLDLFRQEISGILSNSVHVGSGRPRVDDTYVMRRPRGLRVEEVPYLLASDSTLEYETNHWFAKNLDGTQIVVDRAGFAFRLLASGLAESVPLASSGRGTQSALPVVTLLQAAVIGLRKPSLMLLEEPEEHLHPSAHPAIADLVIAASKATQLIVETHSENFILRLRRRIAEGVISPSHVGLYYLGENHELQAVPIDESGFAKDWPVGVFESDLSEAQAMVEARIAAMRDLEP